MIDQLKIQDPTMQGFAWQRKAKGTLIHPSALTNLNYSEHQGQRLIKGRYIVPTAPTGKEVQDAALEALTPALDQVSDTIHFDQRGKKTTATLYVGNLGFKASTKDLKEALDRVFHKIHVEDVVIPRTDGGSRGYAYVTLSWAEASEVDPSDICTSY
jgi:hypothetical protein